MKLTDATARTLTLPSGTSDKTFFSADLPGFGVRVRGSGARTWTVVYDAPGGKTKRMTLGAVGALSHARALSTARDIFARVRLGEDPAATKAKARTRRAPATPRSSARSCPTISSSRRWSSSRAAIRRSSATSTPTGQRCTGVPSAM